MDAKRGVLVILLLVLLATDASAYLTNVFTGKVKSGESIDIDDYTIIVTLSRQNRLFVDAVDDFANIDLNQCGDVKNIRVCFKNITIDETELVTYVDLEINKTEPNIEITRTISKTITMSSVIVTWTVGEYCLHDSGFSDNMTHCHRSVRLIVVFSLSYSVTYWTSTVKSHCIRDQ